MENLDRPDVNSKQYWDENYGDTGERAGWFHHPKRLGAVKTFFDKEIKEQISKGLVNFIEVGGGTGLGAEIVRADYPELNCYNLDISSKATERGKVKYPLVKQVCHDLNFDTNTLGLNNNFDILICQETIEHLKDPIKSIKYILNFAKSGSWVFFSFPHDERYNGGFEHIQSFDYRDIPLLFYPYADEVTVINYQPYENNTHLHFAVKFKIK